MIRFYIVPKQVSVDGTRSGPKYFDFRGDPDPPALVSNVNAEVHYFGDHPWVLIAADTDNTQNAGLIAAGDTVVFPDNLDTQIGADLPTFQASIEMVGLPGPVLGNTDVYRRVLRGTRGIFGMMDCMQDKGFNTNGVDLDSTVGNLSAAARTALKDCALGMGYKTVNVSLSTTIRELYRAIAAQTPSWQMLGVTV